MAAGDMVTLQCAVTGNPRPDLHWTLDGRHINVTEEPLLAITVPVIDTYSVRSNLTIGPMEPGLAGGYQCVATGFANGSSSVVSSNTTQLQFTCEHLSNSSHEHYITVFLPLCSTSRTSGRTFRPRLVQLHGHNLVLPVPRSSPSHCDLDIPQPQQNHISSSLFWGEVHHQNGDNQWRDLFQHHH